jgi:hypothetical protein
MKFCKVDRGSKLFLKVDSVFKKLSVMLKDFETVAPNKLSNGICLGSIEGSLELVVEWHAISVNPPRDWK